MRDYKHMSTPIPRCTQRRRRASGRWAWLILAAVLGCSAPKPPPQVPSPPSTLQVKALSQPTPDMSKSSAAGDCEISKDPLACRAKQIEAMFKMNKVQIEPEFFSEDMRKARQAVVQLVERMRNEGDGLVTLRFASRIGDENSDSLGGSFEAQFQNRTSAKVRLYVGRHKPHQVTGLWFGELTPRFTTLAEASAEFKRLSGEVSFAVCRLGDSNIEIVASHEPDKALAMGSTFKLYILGALVREIVEGRRRWQEVVGLDARYRSLPSGLLQDWPAGAPMTLHSLAAMMISKSDNTATDNLLLTLGREKTEHMLRMMGNKASARNLPFLATAEAFKLKYVDRGKLAETYSTLSPGDRRNFLKGEIGSIPLSKVQTEIETPQSIESVEWFGSANDLCRAMDYLRRATEQGAAAKGREILAINHGIVKKTEPFGFMGYKGGSEPGVLNLTYLLRTSDNTWWAVSAGWNDATAEDNKVMPNLVDRVIEVIGTESQAR